MGVVGEWVGSVGGVTNHPTNPAVSEQKREKMGWWPEEWGRRGGRNALSRKGGGSTGFAQRPFVIRFVCMQTVMLQFLRRRNNVLNCALHR